MCDQPHAVDCDRFEIKTFKSRRSSSKLCGARTRSGSPCRTPGMPNGRCRLHGGKSCGAPVGEGNGNWRHGRWTKTAQAERRRLRALLCELHADVNGERHLDGDRAALLVNPAPSDAASKTSTTVGEAAGGA